MYEWIVGQIVSRVVQFVKPTVPLVGAVRLARHRMDRQDRMAAVLDRMARLAA
jgi:hypothetical protein